MSLASHFGGQGSLGFGLALLGQHVDMAFVLFQRIHNMAFPNWHFEINDRQCFGRELYLTYRIRAIHTGVFNLSALGLSGPPLKPTGKGRVWPVTYAVITVRQSKISCFEVDCAPGGNLNGTLAWLREPSWLAIQ